jgi:hypothetical protein
VPTLIALAKIVIAAATAPAKIAVNRSFGYLVNKLLLKGAAFF